MTAEEEGAYWAECRADVFPEDKTFEREDGRRDIRSDSSVALAGALHKVGMPAGQALAFVALLWRCRDDLAYSPTLTTVAADCGMLRSSVSRMMRQWLSGGMVAREPSEYRNQFYYSFPCFDVLVRLAEREYRLAPTVTAGHGVLTSGYANP